MMVVESMAATDTKRKPKQTKRKAKPKAKKISGREFLAWLDGIMEFKGEGWTPSPEEWEIILNKIHSVSELTDPPAVMQPASQPQAPLRVQNQPVQNQHQHPQQPLQPRGGSLSSIEIPDSSGEEFRPMNRSVGLPKKDGKVITPNSDKAGYDNSAFD